MYPLSGADGITYDIDRRLYKNGHIPSFFILTYTIFCPRDCLVYRDFALIQIA